MADAPSRRMAASRTCGVAVCGAGVISRDAHVPAILRIPGARLAGVFDVDRARAESLAAMGGGRCYASLDDMLADDGVDLVLVASPNHLRCETVLRIAAAGRHVLAEKPLALSRAEAAAMLQACEAAGVLLRTGFQQRYLNQMRLARLAIRAGVIGEIKAFGSVFSAKWDNFYDGSNFRWDLARSGGATMNDNLIHRFDTVRFLLADDYAEAMADVSHSVIPPVVDDNVHVIVRMAGGARGTMAANRFSPVLSDMTEIYGTEGAIYLTTNVVSPFAAVPLAINTVRERADLPAELVDAAFPPARSIARMKQFDGWLSIWPARNDADAYRAQLASVVAEIDGAAHDGVAATGLDGLRATELVEACFASQREGAWVRLPLPESSELRFPDFGRE